MTNSTSPESEKPKAAPEKAATAEAITTTTTPTDKVDAPVTQNESTPDSAVSQTPKINSPNAAATTAATDTTKKVRGSDSDSNTARPPMYYPYPPYYPFHFRDPAFEIAKKAAAHKNGSPNSKGDPSSPTSPASAAGSAAATPASPYPHPHPYFHPHAAAAYHQWAAAGYYDPYAAAMAYANNNSKSSASEASPHPMPYRYSDHSLRRDAISHHGSPSEKNQSSPGTEAPGGEHPNMAYMMDIEARADGATSPSQIEDFHREEVTSMGCTCKKTKCLKLYCQCFGAKIYCGQNCRCLTCHNLPQYDIERETAIRIILTRNPNAFETKFQKNGGLVAIRPTELAPQQPGSLPLPAKALSHKLGCKCRKSACIKKYCECYAANVKCSSNCRCQGCKNQPPGGKKDGDKSIAVTETASRKDPARHEAAYSLAFLKHGTAEKPARTNSSDKSEAGSMPSMASEESPSGGRGLQRQAEGPKTVPPNTPAIETMPSSEQTAVDALLMAARAMTGMSGPQEEDSTDSADAQTPPIMNGSQNDASPEENMRTAQRNLLGKFMSPKRKVEDASGISEDSSNHRGDERTNGGMGTNTTEISPKRSRRVMNDGDSGHPETGSRDAMETSTPAKGTGGTLKDLTPVSARCIDFKNMRVNDATADTAPT